jgi:hypothetical protein
MVGTGWHCYVIEQGENRIRGYQRLNERRYGKRGRVHLNMSGQGKKAQS